MNTITPFRTFAPVVAISEWSLPFRPVVTFQNGVRDTMFHCNDSVVSCLLVTLWCGISLGASPTDHPPSKKTRSAKIGRVKAEAEDRQGSDSPVTEQESESDSIQRTVASVLVEITSTVGATEGATEARTEDADGHDLRAARVDQQIADWEAASPDEIDDPTQEDMTAEPIGTHMEDDPSVSLASGFREVTPRSEDGIYLAERNAGGAATRHRGRDVVSGRDLGNDVMSEQFDPIMGIGQERLADELARVNLGLTQNIAKDPSQWALGPLRARAQAVIDTSDSASLRRRGHDLLATIAKFEDLRRRHVQLLAGDVPQITSASSLAGWGNAEAAVSPADALPEAPDTRPAYDGKGWLMPVVTRRAGTPHYALTDNSGNILQFVTPPPGVNLKKYERRRIAIYGQQGYLPQLNKPHLTARRVISLDALR